MVLSRWCMAWPQEVFDTLEILGEIVRASQSHMSSRRGHYPVRANHTQGPSWASKALPKMLLCPPPHTPTGV